MAHPTFDTAGPAQRWTGNLDSLWSKLKGEAYRAGGEWVYRVLPRGAAVWLRVPEDFKKELLISRPGHPPKIEETGEYELGAWETEVEVFLNHFPSAFVWHCVEIGPVVEPDGELLTLARFKEYAVPRDPPPPPEPPPQTDLGLEG